MGFIRSSEIVWMEDGNGRDACLIWGWERRDGRRGDGGGRRLEDPLVSGRVCCAVGVGPCHGCDCGGGLWLPNWGELKWHQN